jgi:hypothetical protein
MVPADVQQPNESAGRTTRNRKCGSKPAGVELLVILLASDFPPADVSTTHDFR